MKNSTKQIFVCSSCGSSHSKWMGKCSDCNTWNSIHEELISKSIYQKPIASKSEPIPMSRISLSEENRMSTGISELDRVLGGGLVLGSLTLLSGDPGIGKSTLLLQALHGVSQNGHKILYISGEENAAQIKLRANRLNLNSDKIWISNETELSAILKIVKQIGPKVLVVDSIQTIFSGELPGIAGNVSQIRECTHELMQFIKTENISTFIIGHITKEGAVAGPKLLEHLVDTVLYLEGDFSSGYRILRANKNRFGSTGEIGVFAMQGHGLVEIPNPCAVFMDEHKKECEGSAISISMEGSRPIFIELQVLVGNTTFSSPRRLVTGFDSNRFTILLAVLEKRAGLYLSQVDVYANVTGGFKIYETALDLAAAAAVASSLRGRPLPRSSAFFGEIGLSGEIKMVNHAYPRICEAFKMGFQKVYIPARNYLLEKENISKLLDQSNGSILIIPVENVNEIVNLE